MIDGNNSLKNIDSHLNVYFVEIKSELTVITNEVNSVSKNDNVDKSICAKKLIVLMNSVDSTTQLLCASVTANPTNVSGNSKIVLAWVNSTLIPWLTKLWSSIWSLIQKLLTPKEWKLKGELGTPILGFAKSGLEISFG